METKEIVVQKYGGSSVSNLARMEKVAEYIGQTTKRVVAVVSAMGKETDRLIQFAQEAYGGPPPRDALDTLLVTGEEQAASLLALAIRRLGRDATPLTGREIGLEAGSTGKIKRVQGVERIKTLLDQDQVVVVAGFQGVIEGTDKVVTLGRGGSDLTAIALAAALGQRHCENYTDIDGIFAIDPRIVPKAKRFSQISYSQLVQLTGVGGGKLQDRAVALASSLGVEIRVLLSPSFGKKSTGGTLVCSGSDIEEMEGFWTQPAVAIQRGSQIKISDVPNQPGVASKIFGVLSDINILDSAQIPGAEKTDISLLCLPEDAPAILSRLHGIKEAGLVGEIKISEPLAVAGLTLVYPLMKEEPGYLQRVFEAIGRAGVNIQMFSSSGTTILAVVREESLERAANALGEEFELITG